MLSLHESEAFFEVEKPFGLSEDICFAQDHSSPHQSIGDAKVFFVDRPLHRYCKEARLLVDILFVLLHWEIIG